MCKFGYSRFLHTFPANMLKNGGLANINALLGQKGKNVTGKCMESEVGIYSMFFYIKKSIFWYKKTLNKFPLRLP